MLKQSMPLALALALAATGCTTPTAPLPTGVAAAPAVTPAAPASQPVPPAAPTVATTPVTVQGIATFRGEPLAGYSVAVYDAGSGDRLTATPNESGLSIVTAPAATDASGRYQVQVAGLNKGTAVRVVVQAPTRTAALMALVFGPEGATPAAVTANITPQTSLNALMMDGQLRLAWTVAYRAERAAAKGYRVASIYFANTKVKALIVRSQANAGRIESRIQSDSEATQIVEATNNFEKVQLTVPSKTQSLTLRGNLAQELEVASNELTTVTLTPPGPGPAPSSGKLPTVITKLTALGKQITKLDKEQAERDQQLEKLDSELNAQLGNMGLLAPLNADARETITEAAATEAETAKAPTPTPAPTSTPQGAVRMVDLADTQKPDWPATVQGMLANGQSVKVNQPTPPKSTVRLLGTGIAVVASPDSASEPVAVQLGGKTVKLTELTRPDAITSALPVRSPSSGSSSSSAPAPATVSQAKASVGTRVTLTGAGFSTTAGENIVSFAGETGTINVTATAATATTVTVEVPTGARTGTLSVTTNGRVTATGVALEVVASGTVLRTVTGVTDAHAVLCHASGAVYVSSFSNTNQVVYKIVGGDVALEIPVGKEAHSLVLDGLGNLWVSNKNSTFLTRIVNDAVAGTVDLGSVGSGFMALGPENRLYVPVINTSTLREVGQDGGTYQELRASDPTGQGIHSAAVVGDTIWVTSPGDDKIYPFTKDGTGNLVAGTAVGTGDNPIGIIPTGDGGLWVANVVANTVQRFASGATTPAATIPVASSPLQMAVGKDGGLWVTSIAGNAVQKIVNDDVALTKTGIAGAHSVAIDAAGNVWVTSKNNHTVYQLAP